jgi:hypothetical protein
MDNLENIQEKEVDETEIGDLSPISVLFQTGYFTIDKATIKPEETFKSSGGPDIDVSYLYSLKIPNNEVRNNFKNGLFRSLFPFLSNNKDTINSCYINITKAIISKKTTELVDILQTQLARIPYTQHADRIKMWKYDPKLGEFFFQAIFLSFFDGLGLKVTPEPMSSRGRSDIDILLDGNIYIVLEIKYIPNEGKVFKSHDDLYKDMDKKADEAINQAFKTLQVKKYQNKASKVITAGLVVYDRDIVWIKFADNPPDSQKQ